MPRTPIVLAAALLGLAACNAVIVVSTDGPFIAETGISVPVPPPSLRAEPVQFVAVEGTIGIAEPVPGTMVYMYEGTSERGYFVRADEAGGFVFEGVELDLTDNCVEVWHEEPGAYGKKSSHSYFVAAIAEDDQTVIVEQYGGSCG
jgi:hypothetical protein